MSANKLSYDKLTKELRKNYEKSTVYYRVTRELRIVYKKFTKLFVTRNIFLSAFYEVLQIRPRCVWLITAKSFSPHAVDSAIDWKVLKIIVVNKRNNVGTVCRQCTPLQIEDQPTS